MNEWEKRDDVAQLAFGYVQGDLVNVRDCTTAITNPIARASSETW
jgi:hypothetical protein